MAEYKYKPYTPKKVKYKAPSNLTEDEQLKKSLTAQKENLDARLKAAGVSSGDNRNLVEKALNLTPDQGVLMDVFEILDRPGQSVKGAIAGALDTDADTNFFKGMLEGISGKEEMTGREFLSEAFNAGQAVGFEDPANFGEKAANFLLDVGVDIVTDPLTYIPGGFFTKRLFGTKSTMSLVTNADNVLGKIGAEAAQSGIKLNSIDDFVKVIENSTDDVVKNTVIESFDDVSKVYSKSTKSTDGVEIFYKTSKNKAKGEILETDVVYKLSESLNKQGASDIVIKHTKTSNRLEDIIVYKKKTLENGKSILVKTQSLEVKDLAKGAFGSKSMTIGIENGKVILRGKNFEKLPAATQKKFMKALNEAKTLAGDRPLAEVIQEISEGTFKGASGANVRSLNFDPKVWNTVVSNTGETFGDLLKGLNTSKEYVGYIDEVGELRILKDSDFLKYVDVDGRIMNSAAGKAGKSGVKATQTRMFTGISIKPGLDDAANASDEFIRSITQGNAIIEPGKKGLVIKMLDRIKGVAQGTSVMAKPAQVTTAIADTIGYAFNATKGLAKETVANLARVGGKANVQLQRHSKRLAAITNDLIAKTGDKASLDKVTKILETGGYIDEAGEVIVQARKYTAKQIFDNITMNMADGQGKVILPRFASDLDAKNFETVLNDLYTKGGARAKGFKIINENGSYAIGFTDDFDPRDFKMSVGNLLDTDLETQLSLGKIPLEDDVVEFWKNNREHIDDFVSLRDELTRTLTKELGYTNLPDVIQGGYMRHTLTPDAKKAMNSMSQATKNKFVREGTDVLKNRTFLGTTDEINKGLREFYGLDVDIFDMNAQASLENLINTASQRMEQQKVLKEILGGLDDSGKPLFEVIDNTKESAEKLGSQFKLIDRSFEDEFNKMMVNMDPETQKMVAKYFDDLGFVKGDKAIAVHRSAYNMLQRINRAYVDVPAFVKTYDKFMNTWKSINLLSPGFHMRNLFGNMTNSYLVGMDMVSQTRYAKKAMLDIDNFNKISKAVAEGKSLDNFTKPAMESYERFLDFMESGVSQAHKGVRDLEDVAKSLKGQKPGMTRKLVETNFNIAENMDDFQRYMLYEWALDSASAKYAKTGLSKNEILIKARAEASQKVTDSLFDYSRLTGFEKEYMKRLFPFYTFMKNNLVFQAKNIFTNPGQYAKLGRAYNYALDDLSGISAEDMPKYMQDNMWLPIPIEVSKNDKEALAFLKLNLPVSDFTEFIENPFKRGLTSVTAPVKLAVELGMGVDSFTGAPISEFPGQMSQYEDGVLANFRDEKGTLAISSDPVLQKIASDMGLRVPANYASIGLDVLDSAMGFQGGQESLTDIASRLGLVGVQDRTSIEMTKLYQELEQLRNLKKLYEQESGQKLPSIKR